jgi:membrane dipeptidase
VSEGVAALHADALVCDMTLPWGPGFENQDTTLPRYPASGVDFVSLTVGHDAWGLGATIHHMADVKARLRAESDKYVFVESVDDILQAKAEGKLAVGFHFQGTEALEGDKNLIEVFYDLGVRHLLLAYNQKNRACDGCHERTDCGLSRYGVTLIEEMNRAGMILDLSHTGYRSTMEAMEISEAPVIFSHSNPYGLKEHPRNIRDDQIKACAKTGGVIGINGIGFFLRDNDVSAENFVRHIEYMAELVGPHHVGIGLDFVYYGDQMYRKFLANPERYPAEGYSPDREDWRYVSPESLPQVTEVLLKRRYSEDDIRGILGQNFLRVARQVWKEPGTERNLGLGAR